MCAGTFISSVSDYPSHNTFVGACVYASHTGCQVCNNVVIGTCAGFSREAATCPNRNSVVIGNCAGGACAMAFVGQCGTVEDVYIGHGAGASAHGGCCNSVYNVAIGHRSMFCLLGLGNVAIGYKSMECGCHCQMCSNVAIGTRALNIAKCVMRSVFVGLCAGYSVGYTQSYLCSVESTVGIGSYVLACHGASRCDVFIGSCAGQGQQIQCGTQTCNNVVIGFKAGCWLGLCNRCLLYTSPSPRD